MVKKYSPTVDSKNIPIMKVDEDGHFVHKDTFDGLAEKITAFINNLESVDPAVFTQMKRPMLEKFKQLLSELK